MLGPAIRSFPVRKPAARALVTAQRSGAPRVAVVTGAGKGLGRAIALRLAQDGFDVAINDIPACQSHLDSLKKEIMQHGRRTVAHIGDVSSQHDVKALVQDAAKALGGLDVMVANAGICITKPFLETSGQDWDRIQGINSKGTFLCYKYAALQMIEQGRGGRIIGAASVASKQAWGGISIYSSTKFLIRGMTQAAAQELGQHNITVNAYAPGPIDTDMLVDIGKNINQGGKDAFYAQKAKQTALGVMARPVDIAGVVSYLAGPDAERVTGQTIIVDGGAIFD